LVQTGTTSKWCATNPRPDRVIAAFDVLHIDRFDGGPRLYQQVVEQLELCQAQSKAHTPDIEALLKNQ
jgi:hypothetical protein